MSSQTGIYQVERPMEELLVAACYNGERFVVRGQDGIAAAIVPLEDLEVLENLEKINEGMECQSSNYSAPDFP